MNTIQPLEHHVEKGRELRSGDEGRSLVGGDGAQKHGMEAIWFLSRPDSNKAFLDSYGRNLDA